MNCKDMLGWLKDHMVGLAWVVVVLGLVVLAGYLVLAGAGGQLFGTALDLDKSANIGTFVGGTVGALWALAGVFFFYAALQLQRADFNLQREELKDTRKVFERQAFEITFFNLIEQKRLAEQAPYKPGDKDSRSIDVTFEGVIDAHNTPGDKAFFYSTQEYDYSDSAEFLSLVNLLFDSIDAANLKWEEAQRYASIIRGTTSPKGRALYLLYMFTCENPCPESPFELGFFDGLPDWLFFRVMDFPFPEFTIQNKVVCRNPNRNLSKS